MIENSISAVKNSMNIVIVTVCKNNLDGLIKTAKSIEQLQLIGKSECIIWIIQDGYSTDNTSQYVFDNWLQNGLCSQYVSELDFGIYDAMNRAIARVNDADYVLFLNSGDELSIEFINSCDFNFEHHDVIYSDTVMNGFIIKSPEEIDFAFLFGKTINHQSFFIRAELLKKYPFKTEYTIGADWIQLMEIFRNETIRIKKLVFPIAVYEGGGISEKQDELRIQQRRDYLKSIYSDWEIESMMKMARMRQRSWYNFLVKSLDSPKRSKSLNVLAKMLK